ncbi:MAG: cytochrome c [Gammaproteobacteria bacterium]|nr:cytochrome c [Gammaproteobacteria bacterium]MDH5304469.1 cytochrome c [Gammaproteobacteria bacterium]
MTSFVWRRNKSLGTGVVTAATLLAAAAAFAQDDLVRRGEYLTAAGGCISCHTMDVAGAVPLAGGRKLETPFGTFISPNITPDKATGIGDWSEEDFLRALWEGESPDGEVYFPAFPYTAYTGASREDLLAIKAYLFSLSPVSQSNLEHDLSWYVSTRLAASAWQMLNFEPGRFEPDAAQSDEWNRGAYLVRHLGHCGECHTPRSSTGVLQADREMAGSVLGEEKIPNITPHPDAGIGRWSKSDIEYFLDAGMLPDGDFAGSSMGDVIDDNTSRLSREDRLAIAAYLMSLPAMADD